MLAMEWADLLAFIQKKEPTYLQTVRGIPRTEITRIETTYSIILPKIYVDFVETMGASFGAFEPFGGTQICEFPALVRELPSESYPQDRFFKVSIDDSPGAIGSYDTFLDLRRSDGCDAPLVWFEDVIPFSPGSVEDFGYSLGEWLTLQVFDTFELDRRPHIVTVSIVFETGHEQKQNRPVVLDILGKMGFRPALPPLPAVTCLQRPSCSARFRPANTVDGLSIRMGAENRRDLDIMIEQLRDRYPSLMVTKPDR